MIMYFPNPFYVQNIVIFCQGYSYSPPTYCVFVMILPRQLRGGLFYTIWSWNIHEKFFYDNHILKKVISNVYPRTHRIFWKGQGGGLGWIGVYI